MKTFGDDLLESYNDDYSATCIGPQIVEYTDTNGGSESEPLIGYVSFNGALEDNGPSAQLNKDEDEVRRNSHSYYLKVLTPETFGTLF